MPSRTLSEQEFNAIRDRLLGEAPDNLSEDDFNRWAGPRMAEAIAVAEHSPEPMEGSAIGRFAAGAWENLNPVTLAKGVYQAARHPIDTASNLASAQGEQFSKAAERFGQGRYSEALGHGAAGVIPLLGPAAAEAGERIGQGDVAGGLGAGAGLMAPVLAPRGIAATAKGVSKAVPQLSGALERGAASRVARVMRPEVGPNKTRFGRMAQESAPDLLKAGDVGGFSRQALHGRVQTGLSAAEDALDAAADARLGGRAYKTGPIIKDLMEKRRALTAEAVEGSQVPGAQRIRPVPGAGSELAMGGKSIGADVVPGPNTARVAMIDQAVSELKKLGPSARYESIRRIRQAYDGPAKTKYNPSVTSDFLKVSGEASGAADVTGALREALAKFDPETAAANAKYSIYRRANDVLEATAEVERVRPTVGRKIMARLTGAVAGGGAAGPGGALAGFVIAPTIEAALGSGVTVQLQTAALMQRLATAIRAGNLSAVDTLTAQLKRLGAQGAVLTGKTTSPSGPQMQPAGATEGR